MSNESDAPSKEADVLSRIITALDPLTKESQLRILRAVSTFFGTDRSHAFDHPVTHLSLEASDEPSSVIRAPMRSAFSGTEPVSPKNFILEKAPKTDVERVVCLAYYLAHYRSTGTFKTGDISALNTEAAQPKFSNAAYAVSNATQSKFLTAAGDGAKQLTAAGEQFVLNLPDRDAARNAFVAANPRKSSAKSRSKSKTLK
jgi:hypothetical protein